MLKTHAKRLMKLADKLRGLSHNQFNMDIWANECGTVACILGWACQMPEFKKLGLHMGELSPVFVPMLKMDRKWLGYYGHYVSRSEEAGKDFFGLTQEESVNLFLGPSCTPKEAANRIETLVLQHFPRPLEHLS